MSPTVFCHALRRVLSALGQGLGQGQGLGLGSSGNSSSKPGLSPGSSPNSGSGPSPSPCPLRPVVLVGYSQGGRLAMHYRTLFPKDVAAVMAVSAVPGKNNNR